MHSATTDNVKCPDCDIVLTSKSHLKRHVATVHERKKAFECRKCDYATNAQYNLTRHTQKKHEFPCKMCDKIHSSKAKSERHVERRHGAIKEEVIKEGESNDVEFGKARYSSFRASNFHSTTYGVGRF